MGIMNLKLGILGLSDGNGHPYSWSAIFNGYNPEAMKLCGFPVIPQYLSQQKWPESRIKGAKVTSVWSQNQKLSEKIAAATKISKVVVRPEEMIGNVDAILLARDDAENHLELATPFLKAGLPIYIDKPIALSLRDLYRLYDHQQYEGQIFSCSALKYSHELRLSKEDYIKIGEIRKIIAFTPKSWDKYAVHIIEPVLNMLPYFDEPCDLINGCNKEHQMDLSGSLLVNWHSGIQTSFFALGDGVSPITIRVIGNKGYKDLYFVDTFSAFKSSLQDFVTRVVNKSSLSDKKFHELVVKIIEKGRG
jgi:hypothetical protein